MGGRSSSCYMRERVMMARRLAFELEHVPAIMMSPSRAFRAYPLTTNNQSTCSSTWPYLVSYLLSLVDLNDTFDSAHRSTRTTILRSPVVLRTNVTIPRSSAFSTTHITNYPPPNTTASSIPPRKPTTTYTKGTRPQHAENLVAPFASESVDQLYAKRESSDPSETPAFHSSSTSVDPPHPTTTAKLQHTGEEAVGSSGSVRYREPSWEDKSGGNYGTGLQDENAVIKNKDGSKLPDVNAGPDAEQGRKGLAEAWKGRK